jgi:signal transduction histidine kinase/ligand-binding sensor domain-containing protein
VLFLFFVAATSTPAFALDPARNIRDFQHTAWSGADGAPSDVWSLAQTTDGYLWLGTGSGLYRFDGVRFERFQAANSRGPAESDIGGLLAARDGTLWIGYRTGDVAVLRNGKIDFFPLADKNQENQLSGLIAGPDGKILAELQTGIWQIANGKYVPVGFSWPERYGIFGGGLVSAHGGDIWAPTTDGLVHLDERSGKRTLLAMPMHSSFVSRATMTEDHHGQLWLSESAATLVRVRSPDGDPVIGTGAAKFVAMSTSARVMFDRDGTAWGADYGLGIYRFAGAALGVAGTATDRFTEKDGLTSDLAATILEDREGNVWVGTNRGLDRFRPTNVFLNANIPVVSTTGYRALSINGTTYVSASNALHELGKTAAVDPRIPNARPNCIYAARGDLLGLCNGNELVEVGSSTVRHLQVPTGSPWSGVRPVSAALDSTGTLWVAFWNKGIARLRNGNWSVWQPGNRSSHLLEADMHGGVWIYFDDGSLAYATGDEVHSYGDQMKALGGIWVILPLADETLLGTDRGLARVRAGEIELLPATRYPVLADVTGLAQTRDGKTWIHSSAGAVRVDTKAMDAAFAQGSNRLPYQLISYRDGISGMAQQVSYINTIVKGPNDRLYLVTNHGIDEIDALGLHRNTLPPPVAVTGIKADGDSRNGPNGITLATGVSDLEIDYTALSLIMPERVHFRYRLSGETNGWIDAGTRRQAFFTNLRPGDYRFQVIASNNDGVWNTNGASLLFAVPPTFVQSNTFIVLCALAGSACLWLLYSLRLRLVTARIRSRMEERLAERERIARDLHDTLLQGFDGLILRFQSITNRMPPAEPIRKMMDEALERADDVLAESRDSMRTLRPTQNDFAIADAFAATGESAAFGSSAKFKVVTEGEARRLHPIVRDEIAKIGNEAITNAFKHAKAANIEANVVYLRSRLVVTITDDGIGIAADLLAHGRQGHFGLTGMRERAERIKAELSAASRVGAGTTVTLTIPAAIAYADEVSRKWWWPLAVSVER